LGMAIVPDWRGRGLGRKLISAALSRAEDSDLELVQLNVFESNQRALKLYEEFGFSREGLRSNAWKINGELINDIPMSRPLKTRKRKI
ncbi:MAG: GNAT family N-acetyltransferase, partial [Pseudomonadota bacterium]